MIIDIKEYVAFGMTDVHIHSESFSAKLGIDSRLGFFQKISVKKTIERSLIQGESIDDIVKSLQLKGLSVRITNYQPYKKG